MARQLITAYGLGQLLYSQEEEEEEEEEEEHWSESVGPSSSPTMHLPSQKPQPEICTQS
jgi:hypothetical protein